MRRRNLAFYLAVALIAAAAVAIAVATGAKMLDRPDRPPYVDPTPATAPIALPELDRDEFERHCLDDLDGRPLILESGDGGQLSGKPYTEVTYVFSPYRDCFDADGDSLLAHVPPPNTTPPSGYPFPVTWSPTEWPAPPAPSTTP